MLTARRRLLVLALPALLVAAMLGQPAAASAEAGWFRVQFGSRITPQARAALSAAGAEALQYTPTDAYFAFGDRGAQTRAAQLDDVTEVRRLSLADKIDDKLQGLRGAAALTLVGDPATLQAGDVAALGTVVSRYAIGAGSPLGAVEVRADASAIAALASLDSVLYVGAGSTGLRAEDEGSGQVLAGAVKGTEAPKPGYEQFLSERGLNGDGVTVAVVDDGLDSLHPDLAGRIVKRYSYGPENDAVPAEGHGTHVAGIVGGNAAAVPGAGRVKDAGGLLYGLGVAPKVKFVDQPVIQLATSQTDFPPPGGFPQLSRDSLSAGAVVWNASWTDGGGAGAGYVANAAVMDGITRDGDQSAAGSQPLTLVFSAGNSGGPQHRITSPKEAKNIISVASSRGHRAGSVDAISSFSSRGPARDGRIVPTVTAPGETIMSARAATGVLCTAPASGNVKDSPPPDGFGLYTGCSGTSMASPQVAGAVALIHQAWRRDHAGADPSPAMSKALLVNSARDLGVRNIPNKEEGWGRVDLGALFDPTATRIAEDQSVVFDAVGDYREVTIDVVDPSRPLRVTLNWSDAPGAPKAAPALVNDLDLTLVAPDGTSYLGNNFSSGVSVSGGTADALNNTENIFLPSAQAGTYTLRIAAANLPGDGVPNNGSPMDQDYALVVTNARLAP